MNRIQTALLIALFVLGFSGTALANHHNEETPDGPHAECTHAAGEACTHANKSTDKSTDETVTQCTKHAAGEPCDCHGSDDGEAAHG
jgi:hypothetical protein